MSEKEKKAKLEHVGFVSIEGRRARTLLLIH